MTTVTTLLLDDLSSSVLNALKGHLKENISRIIEEKKKEHTRKQVDKRQENHYMYRNWALFWAIQSLHKSSLFWERLGGKKSATISIYMKNNNLRLDG